MEDDNKFLESLKSRLTKEGFDKIKKWKKSSDNNDREVYIWKVYFNQEMTSVYVDLRIPLQDRGFIIIKDVEIYLDEENQIMTDYNFYNPVFSISGWEDVAHMKTMIHQILSESQAIINLLREVKKKNEDFQKEKPFEAFNPEK